MSYIVVNAGEVATACEKYKAWSEDWRTEKFNKEVEKRMNGFFRKKSREEAEKEVRGDSWFMQGIELTGARWDREVEEVHSLAKIAGIGVVHLDQQAAHILREFL